jgi:hypothetical protein
LSIHADEVKTVVRPTPRTVGSAKSGPTDTEAAHDRVRESALERVVRSSALGLSRGLLDLRIEGGGE